MRRHPRRPAERRAAFTLVEVMVSVAIIGSVLAGLLVARGRSVEAHRVAVETMTAARLCSSQAALLRADLLGEGSGTFDNPAGYTWQVRRTDPPEAAPQGLLSFEVSVAPPSGGTGSSAALTVWLLSAETPEG